jgi:hypothetical protein
MSRIKRRSDCVNSLNFEGIFTCEMRKAFIPEAISVSIFARNMHICRLCKKIICPAFALHSLSIRSKNSSDGGGETRGFSPLMLHISSASA